MPKEVINGKNRYHGSLLGFRYDIVLTDDAAFEVWLKKKLERYVLGTSELKVLKELLGV